MDRLVSIAFSTFMAAAIAFSIVTSITKVWFVFDLFFLQTTMPAEVKNALGLLLILAMVSIGFMCKEWFNTVWRLATGKDDQ